MPKIDKVISIEIRPEQYLNSCSAVELQELEILIQSPRYQNKMRPKDPPVIKVRLPPKFRIG